MAVQTGHSFTGLLAGFYFLLQTCPVGTAIHRFSLYLTVSACITRKPDVDDKK
ncbi:hypothetical protein LG58_2885 [Kosakonia radicincitans YD4]|nr:hypothetical protein LG58_2885 [Kosakonia radicincitans YD4]